MADTAMLSVRGEATRMVAPDYLTLQCGINRSANSKADALAQIRAAQNRLAGILAALGGVVLTVDAHRSQLTWIFGSVTTHDEHDLDKSTGQHGPTGRVNAFAAAAITLRDLERTPDLTDALGAVEGLHVTSVEWRVDRDHPAWREVRAQAIAAAVEKARDYAAAAGGRLIGIDHIADVGLLNSGDAHSGFRAASLAHEAVGTFMHGGPGDAPSLDPVPQELVAVVEARIRASVAPLA